MTKPHRLALGLLLTFMPAITIARPDAIVAAEIDALSKRITQMSTDVESKHRRSDKVDLWHDLCEMEDELEALYELQRSVRGYD